MVLLAHADGVVDQSELAAIAMVMQRDGLTDADFKRCIEDPKSINYQIPASDRERNLYLADMIMLMLADGDINKNELLLCKLTAVSLGFKHDIVDNVITRLIEQIKKERGL